MCLMINLYIYSTIYLSNSPALYLSIWAHADGNLIWTRGLNSFTTQGIHVYLYIYLSTYLSIYLFLSFQKCLSHIYLYIYLSFAMKWVKLLRGSGSGQIQFFTYLLIFLANFFTFMFNFRFFEFCTLKNLHSPKGWNPLFVIRRKSSSIIFSSFKWNASL